MINPTDRWTTEDSGDLYDVPRWGKGYFSVGSNGNLFVHPDRSTSRSLDLKALIDSLVQKGFDLPILVRFNGILRNQLHEIHDVFQKAIEEHEYKGQYCCVYPIKVNQQREVVEKIIEYGRPLGFGLEAGSKPELMAVIAMADAKTPVICNGFKDDEFIEMAMIGQKIGRNVIPVVEKMSELDLILKYAQEIGVRPQIGMRVKLATRGSGRWQSSGGYRSKFGLTVSELLKCLHKLESLGMADCFQLLHFHLGSQITNIRQVKGAVSEAVRVYTELAKRGAGLKYIDVGGGLGIDYDGSQTNFDSSMNYSWQEYASDVVYHIQTVCDEVGVPHPNIITESGRAVAAFHSVLVFGTLGVTNQGEISEIPHEIPDQYEQPLHDLLITYQEANARNVLETYHDAIQALETATTLFSAGYLPIDQRVIAENLYFAILHKIRRLIQDIDYVPEELSSLDRILSDTYYGNFSVFQSVPDSWAIKQLFPIMPIHRLHEKPTKHAVICDISCDSDGKIDTFIDQRDVKKTLLLHPYDGHHYYLGVFLIGAYQEILGDLHNLFGDTNAVHVDLDESGEVELNQILKGETVSEVLDYVQFRGQDLMKRLQHSIDQAVQEKRINPVEAKAFAKFYEEGLNGYTYLEEPDAD